jgi:hypothetical protein
MNNNFSERRTERQPVQPPIKSPYRKIAFYLYFPASVFYLELMLKLWSGAGEFRFFTVLLFSVATGMIFPIFGTLTRKRKVNTIVSVSLLSAFAVVYATELTIKNTFSVFMGITTVGGNAGNAAEGFGDVIAQAIISSVFGIVTMAVPPVGLALCLKKKLVKSFPLNWRADALFMTVAILFNLFGYGAVHISSSKDGVTDLDYYGAYYDFNEAVPRFGLSASLRLDAKYSLFGVPNAEIDSNDDAIMPGQTTTANTTPPSTAPVSETTEPPPSIPSGPNIIPEYDFTALAAAQKNKDVKQMEEYFAAAVPTDKNKYTGLFEGKNLIFITAEAFHKFALREDITPTLWKMANEGIVMTEYYQPVWGGGTSTGEYSNLFGLMPTGAGAMQATPKQDISYTIGNKLLAKGYYNLAFHNATSDYYSRNKTHKGLGYLDWITRDTGMYDNYKPWNTLSDEEMMIATLPMYIDKEPFHAYYMSYSGHTPYSKGNALASAHWDAVKNLPYSDSLKAFIAQNIELDLALKVLMDGLEAAGKLDDTVFVISPDHYPYGLDSDGDPLLKEMLGYQYLDGAYYKNFDVMRTTGIIYCSSLAEPIVVTTPTYSLDIAPTVMNLFGIEYDSRLFTGHDMLSDTPGCVIFTNYDWITDEGYYKAGTKKFIPKAGCTLTDETKSNYITQMNAYVKSKVLMTRNIQKYDLYKYLPKLT